MTTTSESGNRGRLKKETIKIKLEKMWKGNKGANCDLCTWGCDLSLIPTDRCKILGKDAGNYHTCNYHCWICVLF